MMETKGLKEHLDPTTMEMVCHLLCSSYSAKIETKMVKYVNHYVPTQKATMLSSLCTFAHSFAIYLLVCFLLVRALLR